MALALPAYDLIELHYRKHKRRLVQRYTRFAGTSEDAEDVVQEAYTRALTYHKSLTDPSFFEQWFSRILKNSFNTFLNAKRGQPTEILDEEELEGIDCPCYNQVFLKQIKEDIDDYDEDAIEVLRLYFNHGYSPRNIRKIVSIKYKLIENIIYRFKYNTRLKHGESMDW